MTVEIELIYPDTESVWDDIRTLRKYHGVGVEMRVPEIIARMHATRAWLMVGYDNWEDLCIDQFSGWIPNLELEDRREVARELTDAGLSTRAIASALGVGQRTIVRDLQSTESDDSLEGEPPREIVGLDGRTRTYQPRSTVEVDTDTGEILTEDEWRGEHPEVATREEIVAAFPTLNVPEASDEDIRRVAEGLAKIPAIERDERAEYGRRWLEAKASGALDGIHQPDPCAPGDLIVRAAIAVCSVWRRNGGAEGFAAAWEQADAFTRENWATGLREAASTIDLAIESIPAQIRRVK